MSSWDIEDLRATSRELRFLADRSAVHGQSIEARRRHHTADFLEQKCEEMEKAMGITDKQAAS